ncbi:MAG: bifunctional tetrahydrofolate synthase/dihydrofolate synthase [Burkholderiaceae bacterium]|nr:bifunctional tetrahydrofolate synthase/dihydrofolate synthase [Burkholderiaceae bacterium]
MTGLGDWLARIERLHPKSIELGLERVRAVAQHLAPVLECVVITVGGTNGKGSTCAMLEAILRAAGYRVALYTSPHLLAFNERARIDGAAVGDAALVAQFEAVDAARGEVALTYFEFTTLAILRLFAQAKPDVAILEVGLGGRLDAVNIIDADCAIVTSVDIDHTEYLGDTREAIGWEKAHIFRTGRAAICCDPAPPKSVLDYAREIDARLWLIGRDFGYAGDRRQWSYRGPRVRRNALAFPALRGANQLLNAAGALAALEALEDRLVVSQQAVRQGLAAVALPGRFQLLPGRPAVVLDVAHNPHAAAHLAENLDSMGYFPVTWAVFGVMADKDVAAIVRALGDRIDHWMLCNLPGARAARADDLVALLAAEGVVTRENRVVRGFESPREAYEAARTGVGENDRIVVFGSFLTVADVLDHLGRRGRPT